MRDLFGLAEAFSEEEQPDLTLDDLMSPLGQNAQSSSDEYNGMPRGSGKVLPKERRLGSSGTPSAQDLMRQMKKDS